MAAIGDAMLVDSGPTGLHLHIVIWGPSEVLWLATKDQFILACVTTLYPGAPHDPACILQPGDHDFIKHDSYVTYRRLRVDEPAHVDLMLGSGKWTAKGACTAALVKKIRIGLCTSKTVDRRFKALLNCPP